MIIDRLTIDGSHAHYFLLDDEGNELRQVDRDIADELAKAKRQKRAVADLIAETEGGKQVKDKRQSRKLVAAKPDLPVQDHTHEEFSYPVSDHSHDVYARAIAILETSVPDLARALKDLAVLHNEATLRLGAEIIDFRSVANAALNELAGQQAEQLQRITVHRHGQYAEHDHQHPHDHAEMQTALETLVDTVTALSAEMAMLRAKQDVHSHPLESHAHEHSHEIDLPDHDHPRLTQALAEHVEDVKRRTNARILSEQEVGGKRRLVIEEEG